MEATVTRAMHRAQCKTTEPSSYGRAATEAVTGETACDVQLMNSFLTQPVNTPFGIVFSVVLLIVVGAVWGAVLWAWFEALR